MSKRETISAWWCEDGLWNVVYREAGREWTESYRLEDGDGNRIRASAPLEFPRRNV